MAEAGEGASTRVGPAEIQLAALHATVAHPGAGALSSFVGVVRDTNAGARVLGIDYEAYDAMAAAELTRIAEEACGRWDNVRVAAAHRTGYLRVGDVSVAVVAAAPHRAAAFEACRHVVEEIKRRLPVWKREHYADGRRAWVDARAGSLA